MCCVVETDGETQEWWEKGKLGYGVREKDPNESNMVLGQ